jgi:hypothetical protein
VHEALVSVRPLPVRRFSPGVIALAFGALLVGPGVGRAQPSPAEKAEADALFSDARRLMAKKKYSEACRKLETSQKIDPAGGTLLNLALCHELEGRLATAWVEFSDALAQAKADKKPDRVKLAREHIAGLEARLPKITIVLEPGRAIEGLRVKRDAQIVADALFGTAVPVDPGDHVVSAEAPGYVDWQTTIKVGPGEAQVVTIPPLRESSTPRAAGSTSASASAARPPPPDRSTLGLVVGGVGVVALGVGTYFGLRTLSLKGASDDLCPTSTTCSAEGVERMRDARTSATIANIGLGVGALGVGVGVYLVTALKRPGAAPPKTAVAPTVGPGLAGVSVAGHFLGSRRHARLPPTDPSPPRSATDPADRHPSSASGAPRARAAGSARAAAARARRAPDPRAPSRAPEPAAPPVAHDDRRASNARTPRPRS